MKSNQYVVVNINNNELIVTIDSVVESNRALNNDVVIIRVY